MPSAPSPSAVKERSGLPHLQFSSTVTLLTICGCDWNPLLAWQVGMSREMERLVRGTLAEQAPATGVRMDADSSVPPRLPPGIGHTQHGAVLQCCRPCCSLVQKVTSGVDWHEASLHSRACVRTEHRLLPVGYCIEAHPVL